VGNGTRLTNTTWEYDGTTWIRGADGPLRASAAMSFDPVSRRVLLQGGFDQSGFAGAATWAWNGTTWSELGVDGPEAQVKLATIDGGVLALDSRAETWAWNGATWAVVVPRPAPGYVQAAAWDPQRNGIVCWERGQTWLWTGSSFQDAGTGPRFLNAPRLFFDETRAEMVAVGGMMPSVVDAGTWRWSGLDWTPGPTVVEENYWTETAAATFDTDRRVGVVVSSSFGTHEYEDGGWRFLGRLGLNTPSSFRSIGVAHDPSRATSVVLLTSGATFERADGGAWTLVADAGAAPYSNLVAFDAQAQAVTALREDAVGPSMLRFDGQRWNDVRPGRLPPGNASAVMTWDAARGRLTFIQGPSVFVYLP
jgi:hypothetical protein